MPKYSLNQNLFAPIALIGDAAEQAIDTVTCQINPNTTASYITAGCAVKLISNVGPEKVVDVTSGPSDGPVFGVIAYDSRTNSYSGGLHCQVHTMLNVVYMLSASSITRGQRVAVTNQASATTDPTVAADTTGGDYTVGVAETQPSGSGSLVKVRVSPAYNLTTANGVFPIVSP